MSYPPSMVHKSGDQLVVRSVVSGNKLYGSSEGEDDIENSVENSFSINDSILDTSTTDQPEGELPQCKVKRNYACSSCSYYTQNPRYYLHHLKNVHNEKIRIYECPHCLYASKHSQKLQRHIHMVHVMGKRKLMIKTRTNSTAAKAATKSESIEKVVEQNGAGMDNSLSNDRNKVDSKPEPVTASLAGDIETEENEEQTPNEIETESEQLSKCSLCSFSSRNANLVTRHERLVHLKKKFYRCSKCDYITHMKARFTKHVKYHSMPMIKCEMCDFRTPYKWNLDRHNKNHFANGAFKCSQCNFTADIKQSLTVHEMNHHVPPVNGANGNSLKRRCRVGASDIIDQQEALQVVESDLDDLELLRMERESIPSQSPPPPEEELDESAITSEQAAQMATVEITMVKPNVPGSSKSLNLKNPTAAAYLNGTLKPEDVILTKNGSVYVKKFKCRVCQYKAAWESEMIRHELRVHGIDPNSKKKAPPKPLPNLIPIQNNGGSSSGSAASSPNRSNTNCTSLSNSANSVSNSLMNRIRPQTRTSTSKTKTWSPSRNGGGGGGGLLAELEYDKPLTEKDLNDIYNKSCATSSLKDFASLIGTDESTVKSDKFREFMSTLADERDHEKLNKTERNALAELIDADDVAAENCSSKKVSPDTLKKKNASFFDKLKEKLIVGGSESHNLACWCGHKSKCLSESVLHQKTHSETLNDKTEKSNNAPMISGADLSSTRCQHCRQRCKTSSDLFVHLQSCPEIIKKGNETGDTEIVSNGGDLVEDDTEIKEEIKEEPMEFVENPDIDKDGNHKVFVWNNFNPDRDDSEEYQDDDFRSKSPLSESSLVGYEIAPGIGSIMPSTNNPEETMDTFKELNIDVQNVETTTKKVFKCPTCTFWASTASRFHVHIVSHMNVKPFGCSVCPYQSKWKWDVTKHIKLKRERDPTHEKAEMRTIDVETGRRNYTKYNRFLTVMRVHEPKHDLSSSAKNLSPKLHSPGSVLPRLTPAPSMNRESDPHGLNEDLSIRPLPQLHPAHPNIGKKRPLDGVADSIESPKKKAPSEKKMWKCKRCIFRNTDRNVVLAHVKIHYENGTKGAIDTSVGTESEFEKSQIGEGRGYAKNTIKCDLCSYETDNQAKFRVHSSHHVEDPTAAFRCCFCPFFSNDKPFMINHIASHGVNNVEESFSAFTNNEEDPLKQEDIEDRINNFGDDQNFNDLSDSGANKSESACDESESHKRFKCGSCPYVTNNKSQYLYHKQFHKQRGAPFKCNICSYNVTKRHLLHQHLKIHGVQRAQFKSCVKDAAEKESAESERITLNPDIETAHLTDIPLVWVCKRGNLTKMFKCRHCPHVNLRKSNIHEHEKMHFERIQRSPSGSFSGHPNSTHHCSECNYVCNNAGALASHFKVHQGVFGQICALADSRRSDESQIREISKLMESDNRFKEMRDESLRKVDRGADVNQFELVQDSTVTSLESKEQKQILHFCCVCPSRFICQKDLESHLRFHGAQHGFKCNSCTYSAPQQAQLLAHNRVHTNEYQEKTNLLILKHEISTDFPRPKTALIFEKQGFAGLGWVVVHSDLKKDETKTSSRSKVMTKQFSCHKCPARFFKSVALQHHLTLHGGKDQYQCRGCDYRVKTYGNLIKHEAVHNLEPRLKAKALKKRKSQHQISPSSSLPASSTEYFQQHREQMNKDCTNDDIESVFVAQNAGTDRGDAPNASTLPSDPEFGTLIHGSPEFIYPQIVKNGKWKEKKYKCHKCPSAFEKREQYKTHVSLHGAKSRFKCTKCDYSVKYFANYTQHLRKHELNEKCRNERRPSTQSKGSDDSLMEKDEIFNSMVISEDELGTSIDIASPEKSLPVTPLATPMKAAKTLHISVADKQAVVLMQQKISEYGINMADALYRCYYCPYSHMRKDAVESHERCHLNPKGTYTCEFCNYTVPQLHFLREHQKLHFGPMKGVKPEAYMKCDRLEIWMETEEGKVLIFKDSGRTENRFEPPIDIREEDSEFQKLYVNSQTAENLISKKSESVIVNSVKSTKARILSKSVPESTLSNACNTDLKESGPRVSASQIKEEIDGSIGDLKDEPAGETEAEFDEELKDNFEDEEVDDVMNGFNGVDVEAAMSNESEDECEEEMIEDGPIDSETLDTEKSNQTEMKQNGVSDQRKQLLSMDVVSEDGSMDVDVDVDVNEYHVEPKLTNGEADPDVEDALEVDTIDDTSTATSRKLSQLDENTNSAKTASDDSDSEDSDSSSSSSSCSGSSCSSTDSSDEEKENGDEKESKKTDVKKTSIQANQKD